MYEPDWKESMSFRLILSAGNYIHNWTSITIICLWWICEILWAPQRHPTDSWNVWTLLSNRINLPFIYQRGTFFVALLDLIAFEKLPNRRILSIVYGSIKLRAGGSRNLCIALKRFALERCGWRCFGTQVGYCFLCIAIVLLLQAIRIGRHSTIIGTLYSCGK